MYFLKSKVSNNIIGVFKERETAEYFKNIAREPAVISFYKV